MMVVVFFKVDGLCVELEHTATRQKVEVIFRAVIGGVTIDVDFWKDAF